MIKIFPLYEVTLIAVYSIIKTNLDCDLIWANGVGIFRVWMCTVFAETNEALYGSRIVIRLGKFLKATWLSSFFTNFFSLPVKTLSLECADSRNQGEIVLPPFVLHHGQCNRVQGFLSWRPKQIFLGRRHQNTQGRPMILCFVSSS